MAEPILGICGGYQMLGRVIDDSIESGRGVVEGLGLLPVKVNFGAGKVLGRPTGAWCGHAGRGVRDTPRDCRDWG